MCSAFTTAAVINGGFCRPEEPASALAFMPNHKQHEAPTDPKLTDEELAEESEFWEAVRRETLRQKAEIEARNG